MKLPFDLDAPLDDGVSAKNRFWHLKNKTGLPDRVILAFIVADLNSLRAIISKSERQLLCLPNFGKESLIDLKLWLSRYGLTVGMDLNSIVVGKIYQMVAI